MISKSCKYALRATIFIASRASEGVKLSIKDIAREIDAPEAFTAKLLQALNKHRIVTSLKGPYGGFYSEKSQLDLPIISIVNAIDGLSVFRECGMGLHQCSDLHPCPLHFEYAKTRDQLKNTFQQTTIASLAANLNEGSFYINNA
ncbi:BadM/Rrf2 family transcriptional regulator [Flammeovirgaceae bacterium 311]|nr:BadM/Rrf2 family transcriptional regulator [Flammeovirgaceae bacterium 311]